MDNSIGSFIAFLGWIFFGGIILFAATNVTATGFKENEEAQDETDE